MQQSFNILEGISGRSLAFAHLLLRTVHTLQVCTADCIIVADKNSETVRPAQLEVVSANAKHDRLQLRCVTTHVAMLCHQRRSHPHKPECSKTLSHPIWNRRMSTSHSPTTTGARPQQVPSVLLSPACGNNPV